MTFSFLTSEEAVLTKVKVEAAKTTISGMTNACVMQCKLDSYTMLHLNSYLRPMIGCALHKLHLAWCLQLSLVASLWYTGIQTIDWGSKANQSRNCLESTVPRPLLCSRQLATLGSILAPPNELSSPNCLGMRIQLDSRRDNWLSFICPVLLSARQERRSERKKFCFMIFYKQWLARKWRLRYSQLNLSSTAPRHITTNPTRKLNERMCPWRPKS